MQQAKRKDIFYRARCHLSLLDNRNMDKGYKFSDLPETYIIFFCDFDIKNEGKPIYFGGNSFYDGERIDDGAHSVYVNCKYEGRSNDIGKLIHDMKSKIGEKKCYNVFSKQERKGDYQMSDFWERVRKETRKEVYKEAEEQARKKYEEKEKESIITMLKNGLDISLISDISKKSTSEILAIKSDNCL